MYTRRFSLGKDENSSDVQSMVELCFVPSIKPHRNKRLANIFKNRKLKVLPEADPSAHEFAARYCRELRKRITRQQYIDVIYNVHVDEQLQVIMKETLHHAWLRTFGATHFSPAAKKQMIADAMKIFSQQAQEAYERFHLVQIVGEA